MRLKIKFTDCELPCSFPSILTDEQVKEDLWRMIDLISYNLKTELISNFPDMQLYDDSGTPTILVFSNQSEEVSQVLCDIIAQLLQQIP